MAISNDQAAHLIEHIEHSVRVEATKQDKQGIIDIINQWRSDVEAGRQIERKLTVRQSPGLDVLSDTPRTRSTSSGEFVGKEDFTPIEQLDMLITALGLAFVAPQMMAQRFIDAISEYSGADAKAQEEPVVRFIELGEDTDLEPDADYQDRISRQSISQSREHVEDLATLLLEISDEAGLSHRKLTDSPESY